MSGQTVAILRDGFIIIAIGFAIDIALKCWLKWQALHVGKTAGPPHSKTGEPPHSKTGGPEGRYRWTPAIGDVPTRNTTEPCPHCRARCPECNDEGKLRCQAFGCGGRGFIVHAQKLCTALPADQPHPKTCECHGSKRIVTQSEVCPVCQGTGFAKCALCNGTTQVSTGRQNKELVDRTWPKYSGEMIGREAARILGTDALWRWHAAAPPCEFCRGTGLVQETLNEADKINLQHARKTVAELRQNR